MVDIVLHVMAPGSDSVNKDYVALKPMETPGLKSSQSNHFWSVKVLLSVFQVQLFTFYKYIFCEYFYFYLSSLFFYSSTSIL